MEADYFRHPRRLPKNVEGPFYTTGSLSPESSETGAAMVWSGDCLQCEAPEAEAPELLAKLDDSNDDTYFVRQPSTPFEIADACSAIQVCCVSALRYGGRDRSIIKRLGNDPEVCDYVIDQDSKLVCTVDANGDLLPGAGRASRLAASETPEQKRWWEFWK